jgi:hypothetical protein
MGQVVMLVEGSTHSYKDLNASFPYVMDGESTVTHRTAAPGYSTASSTAATAAMEPPASRPVHTMRRGFTPPVMREGGC